MVGKKDQISEESLGEKCCFDNTFLSSIKMQDFIGFSSHRELKEFILKSNNVILHIPHSSTLLPQELIDNSTLSEQELMDYSLKMSDLYTDLLFEDIRFISLKAPYSRLYCDVEKFIEEKKESIKKYGMGVVYRKTYDGVLFNDYDEDYKDHVLNSYYFPYHKKLDCITKEILKTHDSLIIIDCHSYSDKQANTFCDGDYSDICLAYFEDYMDEEFVNNIQAIFKENGYSIKVNYPYVGSMIPYHFKTNKQDKVISLVINVNKKVYLDKKYKIKEKEFNSLQNVIKLIYDYILTYNLN